jgi:DnaJ-class molecular chaperone
MASQIANSMSDDDKSAIENMDMEKMISHVTKNVFKMMNVNGPEITEAFHEQVLPKTRDICFDLNVDLIDFYTSKKKKLNIKRKRVTVDSNGKQIVVEDKKKIVIPIEKGMKDEQQIVFKGEADQIPGYTPGDIIITLVENEHPVFQRDGDNLVIVKNVNLYQIYDYTFDITHLDSRVLRICKNKNDSLHLNDSLRKIPGEGMPIYKQDKTFGDLFIRFNLIIPKSLEPENLLKLKDIFDNETEQLSNSYTHVCVLENVTETDLEEFESSSSSDESSGDSDSDEESSSESELSEESSGESEPRFKSKPRK